MYNLLDVLFLTDVFKNFIEKCKKFYGINPLYCYSAPGFTFKAFFKFSNMYIEYIKDHELLLLIENNIRGGISGIMGDRYIQSDENKKILYIDANNLYGYAMSQFLPIGNFIKLEIYHEQKMIQNILNTPDNSEIGYFILVDLEYPANLKLKTEIFPLCAYKTKADPNLFSEYINSVKQDNNGPTEKLVCDQTDRYNYFVHYRLLKFYLKMGMKIIKIHTIYQFKQRDNIKKYIEFNTDQRKIAKTDFEKKPF